MRMMPMQDALIEARYSGMVVRPVVWRTDSPKYQRAIEWDKRRGSWKMLADTELLCATAEIPDIGAVLVPWDVMTRDEWFAELQGSAA